MTDSRHEAVIEELRRLQRDFLDGLPDRLRAIRDAAGRVRSVPDGREELAALHRLVHALAGTAGTYGLPELSAAARAVEQAASRLLASTDPLADQDLAEMTHGALWLEVTANRDPLPPLQAFLPLRASGVRRRVALVGEDVAECEGIGTILAGQGYEVTRHGSAAALGDACRSGPPPDLVVIDFPGAPGQGGAGRGSLPEGVPAVFLSVADDAANRLAAYRAGATRCLSRPVDTFDLVAIINDLIGTPWDEPLRALLVDDDPDFLAHCRTLLEHAGVEVRAVGDPLLALGAAGGFAPDVVVLDLYMPGCNGPELAALLRDSDPSGQAPVLYLSVEADPRKQLSALDLGGDAFLLKTVDAAYLVDVVRSRARLGRRRRAERRRLDAARRELTRKSLALDAHAIVSVTDAGGNILHANDMFCRISGYSREDLIGRTHRIVKSDHHPATFFEEMWRTIAAGHVWRGEICNRARDGSNYWVQSTIVPLLDDAGLPFQYLSVRTDITALKASEESLRVFAQVVAASPSAILVADARRDGLPLVHVNPAFERISGYAAQEVVGQEFRFLNAGDCAQPELDALRAAVSGRRAGQALLRSHTKDGSILWCEVRLAPVFDAGGELTHYVAVNDDVTEREAVRAALEESEARLRRSQAYANVGSIDLDLGNCEVHCSERVGPLLGLAGSVLDARRLFDAVDPRDRARVVAAVQASASAGTAFDVEFRVVHPDGRVRWLLGRGDVVRDTAGPPRRLLGVIQDLTWRKEAEAALVAARDSAEGASRAKTEFLSSMSHELRTPMNAILGFGQLLDADPGLDAGQRDGVREILKAGRHLLELINEVLDLAKIEAGHVALSIEPVQCGDVLDESLALMDVLAQGRSITIVDAVDRALVVRADRTRLKQVLINLLSNAVKYNRDGGRISLASAVDAARGLVRIEVADTGAGLPPDRIGEIFRPFGRIVAADCFVEGTGIGLALCRRLLDLMGGAIGVDSRPGEGSRFWIELPAADAAAALPAFAPHCANANQAGRGTVLYVEDNPANLRLMAQIFVRRPHLTLLTAPSASLGIDLALARRPDLVLLDINLPGMSGYEVLGILRRHPELDATPVAAVTASAMPDQVARGRDAGFDAYLTKPLDVAELLSTVDGLLGRRAGTPT